MCALVTGVQTCALPILSDAPASRPSPLILAILLSASAAAILSTDLYAPTLPHLPAYFDTDVATVQLTMGLNIAAFPVSLLLWVPLSDRYGRRAAFLRSDDRRCGNEWVSTWRSRW